MTVAFILMEHRAGLTAERLERYERARARIASVVAAPVRTVHYERLDDADDDALVLSGSSDPWSRHDADALRRLEQTIERFPGPVLGICAGMQVLARACGGEVRPAAAPTRGFVPVEVRDGGDLLRGIGPRFDAFADHEDEVGEPPPGLRVLASSATCAVEAFACEGRPWWGTQFHPERWDAAHPAGRAVLARFFGLAGLELRPAGDPFAPATAA